MSGPPQRLASFGGILALSEGVVGKVLGGALFTLTRGPRSHTQPRGGNLGGLELHLGSDAIVADLSGWKRNHLPALPDTAVRVGTGLGQRFGQLSANRKISAERAAP
jgi:hypothetical protein